MWLTACGEPVSQAPAPTPVTATADVTDLAPVFRVEGSAGAAPARVLVEPPRQVARDREPHPTRPWPAARGSPRSKS